jgi:hypothetical protein
LIVGAVETGTTVWSIFVGAEVARTCGRVGTRLDVGATVLLIGSVEGCWVGAISGIVVGCFVENTGVVVTSIGATLGKKEGGNVVGFAEGLLVVGIEVGAIGMIEGIGVGWIVEGSDVVGESVGAILGNGEGGNVVGFIERLLVGDIEVGGFVGCVRE